MNAAVAEALLGEFWELGDELHHFGITTSSCARRAKRTKEKARPRERGPMSGRALSAVPVGPRERIAWIVWRTCEAAIWHGLSQVLEGLACSP